VQIAIVDIGTNSTRLLIADVENGRVVELDRQTNVTRLGAGVDAEGQLQDEAMERVFAVLDDYRDRIDTAGTTAAHAVLTSAVRDAANGGEFAGIVRDRFGLHTHVLSGDEEARLTYLGATSGRAGTPGRTLVIDIGGGSTEFVIGTGPEVEFYVSTQAGVVRQTERHIHHDPPAEGELAAVALDVRRTFTRAVPSELRAGIAKGIGVAGTPTSLAAIAQRLDPYDRDKTHGYLLSAAQRDAIFARLAPMALSEREQVTGLHPARAPVILPGIVILTAVMDLFGLDEIEVSEHDILRGAALAFAAD
jgi:exopolyphosphatase / guanosine-5'-triphosphate,3'-diphosphate pyrophosphatase